MMRMNVWRQKKGSVCVKIMAHATPLDTGMARNEMVKKCLPSIPFGSACDGTEIPCEALSLKSPNPRFFPDPSSFG